MWIKLLLKFLSGQLFDFLMCFRILAWKFILILYFSKISFVLTQAPRARHLEADVRLMILTSLPTEVVGIFRPFSMSARGLFS